MNNPYIFASVCLAINGITLSFMCYFMYKSTVKIAAMKRASDPWQAIALQSDPEKQKEKNESAQTNNEDFDTLPNDVDLTELRKAL